jgi:hypothetical protein
MEENNNYSEIKNTTEQYYRSIGHLRSLALNNEKIHFNSEGFNHLVYKGAHAERDKNVQIMKFKLLHKAIKIISVSTTYQEYDERLLDVCREKYGKKIRETVTVKFWGLVAIIDNFRVKVIIRQAGNGQKHFWSVIPAWTKSYYKDIKIISNAKGDLLED